MGRVCFESKWRLTGAERGGNGRRLTEAARAAQTAAVTPCGSSLRRGVRLLLLLPGVVGGVIVYD